MSKKTLTEATAAAEAKALQEIIKNDGELVMAAPEDLPLEEFNEINEIDVKAACYIRSDVNEYKAKEAIKEMLDKDTVFAADVNFDHGQGTVRISFGVKSKTWDVKIYGSSKTERMGITGQPAQTAVKALLAAMKPYVDDFRRGIEKIRGYAPKYDAELVNGFFDAADEMIGAL